MIQLTATMRSSAFLGLMKAFEVTDHPDSPEEATRAAMAHLVAFHTHTAEEWDILDALQLANALDEYLLTQQGPFQFDVESVIQMVGYKSLALWALKLLGAFPKYHGMKAEWTTAQNDGERTVLICFPPDTYSNWLQASADYATAAIDLAA